MNNFLDKNGKKVSRYDSSKLIWYGLCGFWTDDWDSLKSTEHKIPCCPKCGTVGMQTEAKPWFQGAQKYDKEGHPNYHKFLLDNREICFAHNSPRGFLEAYEESQKGKSE